MKEEYSIVISFPEHAVDVVTEMKLLLGTHIGWYHSKNSKAHVTLLNFEADQAELNRAIVYIESFCLRYSYNELKFLKVDSFPSAFYLAPSDDTYEWLKELMIAFTKGFPLNKKLSSVKSSVTPHVSIARQLDSSKISKAYDLFRDKKIDIGFLCDRITLRKLDVNKGQYFIVAEYLFQNQTNLDPEKGQLSLF